MENLDLGLNLGFGNETSIDNLIEKINTLEKGIANINEVSNVDMFTNTLKNFQDLKNEIKQIKELFNDTKKNKINNSTGKNPYKNETFNASQTLVNIEKVLREISNYNKTREHSKKVEKQNSNKKEDKSIEEVEFIKKYNKEFKHYNYRQGNSYKDKDNVNTEKLQKLSTLQYESFTKLAGNFSKNIVEALDKNIREKMVNQGSVKMLKNGNYLTEDDLIRKYEKISKIVSEAGFDGNLMKSNPKFKKEYNNILNENSENRRKLDNIIDNLNKKFNIKKNMNLDGANNKEIENLLKENRNLYNLLNSKKFQDFGGNTKFKNTEDKINHYENYLRKNEFKIEQVKSKGLSLPNTIQQNTGMVIAGLEAFRYMGQITNFITSKDFERNMGALGIVGNLGNQASQNASKDRIIRESNSVGADINEFATGVREVIKTGKSYEQSMNLVSMAGKIAIASFEDLTTATNILNARFTALNINATDKNLNEFANRLQSALDNTALDLQDVSNAGKQTNTAMNAIINSAEEKGIQNRSIEQYTMDVSNLELALLSTLKQQGKTGEQSGVVLRTLFTKLMSVDGVGAKMLDNDLKKMTKEERAKVGFSTAEEMSKLVTSGDLEKAIQGLSELQKQGNLTYGTLKHIVTERHSSAISTLLSEVNGDVKGFVDNITTGIDVTKNFEKAMENWSVKVDRIFKNFKSITTNTFSRGVFGGVLGTTVGTLDFITDNFVKLQSNNNILASSFGQSVPQAITQGLLFKNFNQFTKGKAFNKLEEAYGLSYDTILKDKTISQETRENYLTNLTNAKNKDLDTLLKGDSIKTFAGQIKATTSNVYNLSDSITKTAMKGKEDFSVLSLSVEGLGKSIWTIAKPFLILTAVNMSINLLIGLYEKAQKLKNDADNLDKDVANLTVLGKQITNLEDNINKIFTLDTKNSQDNEYVKNVDKMIQANENFKASIENVNNIKNNLFKDINTIREDLWKEKTKNVLDDTNKSITPSGRVYFRWGADGYEMVEGNEAKILSSKSNRNYLTKYRGNDFKDVKTFDRDYYNKLNDNDKMSYQSDIEKSYDNVKKELNLVDKGINSIYTKAESNFRNKLKSLGLDEKSISKEDKEKYMISQFSMSNELVGKVFGKATQDTLKGNDLKDTTDFKNVLNTMKGNTLEERIKNFLDILNSGEIDIQMKAFAQKFSEYQLGVIKESNELYYKQLELNKESLEQSKAMIEDYKSQLQTMYDKTGIPAIAYGNILTEQRTTEGKLLTFEQSRLDKYNSEYNKDINSISWDMTQNNSDGVKNYQAGMKVYYDKKATLEKQLEDTNKDIERLVAEGNETEVSLLRNRVKFIEEDLTRLEESRNLAMKVLELSNFTAKRYDEIVKIGAELSKSYAQYENLVGTSFGNRGSQLQLQQQSLDISRSLFNSIGKMNYNNQINSAYVVDSNGETLKSITGKTDYSKINTEDYRKVTDMIKFYRENNINEQNGISLQKLQEQATMYSSLLAEKMNLQQQELGFMQQEKQIQIDITKYYLEKNKLLANYTESAESKQSDYLIKTSNLNYSLRYGNGKYNSIEELQRVTNMKLDSSNLKMKDQLDFAKRQIMVAKENSMRQINAIRRLEGKNTTNAQKSDTNAKNNTTSTNRTIIDSANTISNSVSNSLQQIMNYMTSYSSGGDTGVDNTEMNISANANNHERYLAYKNDLIMAGQKTGIEAGFLGAVVGNESGFKSSATGGPGSSVKGIMQIRPVDWNDGYKWGAKYGVSSMPSYMNGQQSILWVASRFAHNRDNGYYKQLGINNPSNLDYYMTHFLGEGGYQTLMKNLDRPLAPIMTKEAKFNPTIFWDKGGRARTGQEIRQLMFNNLKRAYLSYGIDLPFSEVSGGKSTGGLTFKNGTSLPGMNKSTNIDTAMVISGANGLKIKSKEAYAGGKMTQSTYDFAKIVQSELSNFDRFTAFNDGYHKNKSPNSLHTKGQKFDVTITTGYNGSTNAVNQLKQIANKYGYDISIINEYRNPSSKATGGHLDVHVKGKKDGNYPNNTSFQLQNTTLPSSFIPKIDGSRDEVIKKIIDNDNYKDLIKTQKDEAMINDISDLIKSIGGKTFEEGIATLVGKRNSIKSIMTVDEPYDASLSVLESAIQNLESKRDTGSESYDKLKSQFLEILTELQFSFRELNNTVDITNREYTNAYNLLNQLSYTESFNNFKDKIEEIQINLEKFNKKLEVDVQFNNDLRKNLFGLSENFKIAIDGNSLETPQDMKRFLTNVPQMLDTLKILEDGVVNTIEKNFNVLDLDKTSIKNASAENVDKIIAEKVTEIGTKGGKQDQIFSTMNELTNTIELIKTLKTYIEKSNEARKTETELIKQNSKYLSEYSKNISNMIKEVSILDSSKTRNLKQLIAENDLISKGYSLDSTYAKSYMNKINSNNRMEEYRDEVMNFNRMVKYDSNLRNIMKMNGFSEEQLNNFDLNNTSYGNIRNIANSVISYQENTKKVIQEEVNNALNDFSLKDELKDLDLTDFSVIQGLNANILSNKTGKSVENMQLFLDRMNLIRNSHLNIDELEETLSKVFNAHKSAYEETTKVYAELYKQGLNLLSDILFGEDNFKGLGKEQYSQALDYLLQSGFSKFGKFTDTIKEVVKENKNLGNEIQKNVKNNENKELDTQKLLDNSNINKLLSDRNKTQDLIASTDNTLLSIPKELVHEIKNELNENSLFDTTIFKNIDTVFNDKISKSPYKLFESYYQSWKETTVGDIGRKIDEDFHKFDNATIYKIIEDKQYKLPLNTYDNKSLRDKILKNNTEEQDITPETLKRNKNGKLSEISSYFLSSVIVVDGLLKKQLQSKKQELEMQGKILEMNLQMAETTEERRRIEEQILQNKLMQVDNEYKTNSSFMGGAISGSAGYGIQGALSGATTGMSLGGGIGALVGGGLGLLGGLFGGSSAKIQANQQKAQLIAQQKLAWLAEDRNKYLKTMASAMSEQAKWTTKIGVNDAITRSVRAVISSKDTIGGTASDTRTVQNKKKKGGGLLGSKRYDTVQAYTASYNTNDMMFGGRVFDNKADLEFGYSVLANRILGNKLDSTGLRGYINNKLASSSGELNADQFIKAWNGQTTLSALGMLVNTSRDYELNGMISDLKQKYQGMGASQEKVDMLALINFYENIQALLDKEGKTTKRLFGNYYGIETEEVKDEKGNITEYRRINESMWADLYQQTFQNILNGTSNYDIGSKFLQGTVNAFIQNVSSGRGTVKEITKEFNRLADEIYNVVTRTGEFTNVTGSIKGLINNMELLKRQQKETEQFTIDLAKKWVNLGGNITDIVKDMNNGLSQTIDNIRTNLLGESLENTINNFGSNLFQKLGESMTTNLINKKYADSVFRMNSLLSSATETNSISDIVNLANGYKGLSAKMESDRERLSAIQRLFTANRDIDYVDESIQYETGTSQSVTNNYTFTTDINAGTIVADELSKEILAQNLFAPLVQMLKDSGFIK